MKTHLIMRMIIGAFLGLTILTFIALAVSAGVGTGQYYPVTQESVAFWGSEFNATLFAVISSLVYGAVCGGISIVWDISSWSLTKQTIINCLVMSGSSFPFMWYNFFVPHETWLVITWFLIFIAIYAVIWVVYYFAMRRRIRLINNEIRQNRPQ